MTAVQTATDIVRAVIVEQLGVDPDCVIPEATFSLDLGADSLDVICLVMDLEERFGIDIPDGDVADLETVGALVAYVEQHRLTP